MYGWLIVNLAAPVALPVVVSFISKATPAGKRVKVVDTVKDAQLCWFALTLICATLYELNRNADAQKKELWDGWGLGSLVALLVFNGIFAALAAIEPTTSSEPVAGAGAWLRHYRVLVVSFLLSGVAALLCSLIHFTLARQGNS